METGSRSSFVFLHRRQLGSSPGAGHVSFDPDPPFALLPCIVFPTFFSFLRCLELPFPSSFFPMKSQLLYNCERYRPLLIFSLFFFLSSCLDYLDEALLAL